ncbi:MAG: hypothetical protein GFH24_608350n81 [Chloroflexi bacterium AL-N5]|nr:hypothetical protein [Chloroflexi bacterium AL-N5]
MRALQSFSTLWRVESYLGPSQSFSAIASESFSTLWRVESYLGYLRAFVLYGPPVSFSTLWRVESYLGKYRRGFVSRGMGVSVLCGESKVI